MSTWRAVWYQIFLFAWTLRHFETFFPFTGLHYKTFYNVSCGVKYASVFFTWMNEMANCSNFLMQFLIHYNPIKWTHGEQTVWYHIFYSVQHCVTLKPFFHSLACTIKLFTLLVPVWKMLVCFSHEWMKWQIVCFLKAIFNSI